MGSQENSSVHFKVSIAGINEPIIIRSWDFEIVTLKDCGIIQSSILEVEWNVEPEFSNVTSNYEDLLSSLTDGESEVENEDCEIIEPPISTQQMDLRSILIEWKTSQLDLDTCQNLMVSRRPLSLWNHSLRCFKRASFKLNSVLKVQFIHEPGEDEGGLRRDYFEILFKQMLNSGYFEKNEDGYDIMDNAVGLVNGDYHAMGAMLASMLLQGGPVLPVFNHHFLKYGNLGIEAATLETVCDTRYRDMITKVENGTVDNQEEIAEFLTENGINVLLTANTRSTIVKALSLKCSNLLNKKAVLDSFWEGAEKLGLRTLLKRYPEIEAVLCQKCNNSSSLTGDHFMTLLKFTKYGDDGSNRRHNAEEIQQNFESYIYDSEEGKCTCNTRTVQLEDILKFITGCSSIPPGGFDDNFTVNFTEDHCFPYVSTCTFTLTLPLSLTSYSKFKETMTEAIISGPGFGII